MRGVAQTLCAAGAISFFACGLDTNGLLDFDAGAVGPLTGADGEGVPVDVVAPEVRGDNVDASEASAAPDDAKTAQDEAPTADDATADAIVDATADSTVETTPNATVDATADATVEAYVDAPVDNRGDATADGTIDAPVDSMGEAAVTADGPSDSGSLPIVWDGGSIVDPQFSASDWTSFCVALAACGQMPSISACMALMHQPWSSDLLIPPPSLVLGVNNAGADCARVGQLLGDGSSCPATTVDVCAGNSLVTCRWGFQMTIDCGPLGMVCSGGNGSAGCGFGDCGLAQEATTYCVGTSELVQCSQGRYRPLLSCQTFGATCEGPAGTAGCLGTGGSGCTPGAPVCNGNSIVECMGGLLGSADCSALYGSGFTCIAGNTGSLTCAAGTACDPASYVDTCMGNTATFCSGGATATYDCAGQGWKKGCAGGHCVP